MTYTTLSRQAMDSLLTEARALAPDLTAIRRRLHQRPEVGLHLPETQSAVLTELEGLGCEITLGTALTSVTAVLRGGRRDPENPTTVLLRADMDALPVLEKTGLDFASEIDGAMHACGHDLHMAMLLGGARLLSRHREELAGDVVLMFQPGEEGCNGASLMIEEGVLDASGRRADAAYGMHVMTNLGERGQILSRDGASLSASSGLFVTLTGKGGHGSTPFLAKDPVPALAEIITGLQNLITRRFNIFDPVVLSVGVIRVGGARNVIAEDAHFEATVRSYSEEATTTLQTLIPEYIRSVAQAHGLECEIRFEREYPVTATDGAENQRAAALLTELFSDEPGKITAMANPLAGSEDFSFVLQQVPGTFFFLEATPAPEAQAQPGAYNHSPYVVFDDSVLPDGAAAYACLALGRLAAGHPGASH
jgi:hippurate hydrolase